MTSRFKKDQFILYLTITVFYLALWIHNDKNYHFGVSLVNNSWQVAYIMGMNLLYFEYAFPFVTSLNTNRIIAIVFSIIFHTGDTPIGLYAWRSLGSSINIFHPLKTSLPQAGAFRCRSDSHPEHSFCLPPSNYFLHYMQLKYEGQKIRLEKKQARTVIS